MSERSDFSDLETSDKQDDKNEEEFNIEDFRDEIDSDDSYDDLPDNKNDNEQLSNVGTTEGQEENEYIGPILPGGHRFDKKFLCIKYPGNIVNPEKAIETLGGICAISKAVDTPNRRLELRFRPDDGYCKPACGDRHTTTAFLLRVRVKKSRVKQVVDEVDGSKTQLNNNENCNSNPLSQSNKKDEGLVDTSMTELVCQVQNCSVSTAGDFENTSQKRYSDDLSKDFHDVSMNDKTDGDKSPSKVKTDIMPTFERDKYEDLSRDEGYELPRVKVLGRIDTEFKFINLCDFQYLPMTQCRSNPKELECIYDMIYPKDVPPYSWLRNEVPYFLPPAAFSRMDTVQQYVPKTEVDSHPENIIGKNKKRKAGFSNFIYFSTPDVPTSPPPGIETAMKVKFLQNTHLEQIRQIFEERPIWSKNAIVYKTRFTSDQLKILLPSVAYYFMTGPWRIMWVRLGYDPRKDISARKYQTLDYRLKAMRGLGSTVKCKRNYSEYTLPYKSAPVSKQKAAVLTLNINQEQSRKKERHLNENVYIYREGMVPPSRQMFYQYCDVLVDEIQEMLAKLPDPLPGVKCDEKRGWLPSGFDVQCREIINRQVRAVLRKQMNIPEDHPTTLPRKRKRGTRLRFNKLRNKKSKKSQALSVETATSNFSDVLGSNDEKGNTTQDEDTSGRKENQ